MKFSEKIDLRDDGGIVLNNHPAVIIDVKVRLPGNESIDLPAGGIIQDLGDGSWGAESSGGVGAGVLLEEVRSEDRPFGKAKCLVHGCVNKDRIFGFNFNSGGVMSPASSIQDMRKINLPGNGIYPIQCFDEERGGR